MYGKVDGNCRRGVEEVEFAVSEGMKVRKLYIVNDGAENVDMLITATLLNPTDYRFVRAMCNGREVRDVLQGYHEGCLDLVEFEVWGRERDLYDVAYDLYYIDSMERANLFNMIFVVETEEGEYVEFSIVDIRNWMLDEFVEEAEGVWGEEDELEEVKVA